LTAGGIQTKAWYAKNGQTLKTSYEAVNSDFDTIEKDGTAGSLSGVQTACKKLKTDIGALQTIPAYPVADTATKFKTATGTLANAAADCDNGITNKDADTVERAGTGMTDGRKQLNDAVQLIENDHLGKKTK
jgi:hypothetical protein